MNNVKNKAPQLPRGLKHTVTSRNHYRQGYNRSGWHVLLLVENWTYESEEADATLIGFTPQKLEQIVKTLGVETIHSFGPSYVVVKRDQDLNRPAQVTALQEYLQLR